jgi:hypothetical protein
VADAKAPHLPCPNCKSTLTERLPFSVVMNPVPIYSCFNCGHVW